MKGRIMCLKEIILAFDASLLQVHPVVIIWFFGNDTQSKTIIRNTLQT